MNKSPAYQHYPDKWLADTRRLSWTAKGIYKDLLDVIWMQFQDTCSVPSDDSFIAAELGASLDDWKAAKAEILNPHRPLMTVLETNRLFSNGLWKERCKQLDRREQLARNGSKGGRPKKQKVISDKPNDNQNESLSSPTPSSSPIPTLKEEKRTGASTRTGSPTWMTEFSEAWEQRFGGEMPFKKFARPLASVVRKYGNEKSIEGWKKYLQEKDMEFANAADFSQKAGVWCNGVSAKPEPWDGAV